MSFAMRCRLTLLAAVMAMSCGSSTSPSPALNLSGVWSGMIGQSQSGSALRITWTAAQTGSTVSGPAVLVKPSSNVPASGMLSGTLAASQLTLTFNVPAGSVPSYLSCTIAGSGTASASNQLITGNLPLAFTSCLGSGLEPTNGSQLSLSRQ